MMKRILVSWMAVILLLALVGCGSSTETVEPKTTAAPPVKEQTTSPAGNDTAKDQEPDNPGTTGGSGIRIAVDILTTVLLPRLMAYSLIGTWLPQ